MRFSSTETGEEIVGPAGAPPPSSSPNKRRSCRRLPRRASSLHRVSGRSLSGIVASTIAPGGEAARSGESQLYGSGAERASGRAVDLEWSNDTPSARGLTPELEIAHPVPGGAAQERADVDALVRTRTAADAIRKLADRARATTNRREFLAFYGLRGEGVGRHPGVAGDQDPLSGLPAEPRALLSHGGAVSGRGDILRRIRPRLPARLQGVRPLGDDLEERSRVLRERRTSAASPDDRSSEHRPTSSSPFLETSEADRAPRRRGQMGRHRRRSPYGHAGVLRPASASRAREALAIRSRGAPLRGPTGPTRRATSAIAHALRRSPAAAGRKTELDLDETIDSVQNDGEIELVFAQRGGTEVRLLILHRRGNMEPYFEPVSQLLTALHEEAGYVPSSRICHNCYTISLQELAHVATRAARRCLLLPRRALKVRSSATPHHPGEPARADGAIEPRGPRPPPALWCTAREQFDGRRINPEQAEDGKTADGRHRPPSLPDVHLDLEARHAARRDRRRV